MRKRWIRDQHDFYGNSKKKIEYQTTLSHKIKTYTTKQKKRKIRKKHNIENRISNETFVIKPIFINIAEVQFSILLAYKIIKKEIADDVAP